MSAMTPLERLQALAHERETRVELFLPLPGARWGGDLVARIGIVGPDEAAMLAAEIAAQAELGVEREASDRWADLIAACTTGLYLRREDGKGYEPIPGPTGPMRFGSEFAEAIGSPTARTPRDAVYAAFTEQNTDQLPAVNVTALSAFCGTASTWINDTSREIAGAVVPGH